MQENYTRDNLGRFIKGEKRELSEQHKNRISSARKNEWKNGLRKGGWNHTELSKFKIGLANKGKLKGIHPVGEFKKGHKTWNKGGKNIKIRNNKHYLWKDRNAGYGSLHQWISRRKGRAFICEHCGKVWDRPQSIHWANIDHKYRRDVDDYISLCVSCHRKYDFKNNSKISFNGISK